MSVALRISFACVLFAVSLTTAHAANNQSGTPGTISVTPPDVTYYAANGDTLSTIAQRYTDKTTNWAVLSKRNHIDNDRAIPIGTAIHIPLEILQEEASHAKVFALAGSATLLSGGKETALALGDNIDEGSQITTSKNGFVTLVLTDDSRVSVPSSSQIRFSKLRQLRYAHSPRTEITLSKGRVESKVTPLESNKGRFEVHSPLAVAGVRGTHFRVGINDNGIANEVLSGGVAVGTLKQPNSLVLPKGMGNIINAKSVGTPVQLLPAPRLDDGQQLQGQSTVQITGQLSQAASTYHGQIASDAEAQNVLQEMQSPDNHFSFSNIKDGDYFVRVTAIDGAGLEGMPTIVPITVKTRPEAPHPIEPNGKTRAEAISFMWSQPAANNTYHLQLASDPGFKKILLNQPRLSGTQFTAGKLAHGHYYWRIAAVSATRQGGADHGPFSAAQAFDFLPLLTLPIKADSGEEFLTFQWPSEPGQTFLLQFSTDATFSNIYLQKNLSEASLRIARPQAGVYYWRVRATDADGYVGAFSEPQVVKVFERKLNSDYPPSEYRLKPANGGTPPPAR